MATALERLGGNYALLISLLGRFAADFGSSLDDIRMAIDRGDWDGAAGIAHKLKGAAGNLGANDLHLMAGEVEYHLMARKQMVLDQLLPALSLAFEVLMRSARGDHAGRTAPTVSST